MVNLKLAVRALLRSPFSTSIAVVTLALGIGANAAIFSLFRAVLLRPLPVPDPGSLVSLRSPGPQPPFQNCTQAGDCDAVFSYPMFRDLERDNTAFAGLAGHVFIDANVGYRNQTVSGRVMLVSGSYFPTLALRPALGRLFTSDDDRQIGAGGVVVSHAYWQTQLGADSAVLGSSLVVNGRRLTIVGVAPRGFDGTTLGAPPTAYVPLTAASEIGFGGADQYQERRYAWIYLFARLKPGMTVAAAERATDAIYRQVLNDAEGPAQKEMSAQTVAAFKARHLTLDDGSRGQSTLHVQARMPLVLLLATTAIVLLIACANIANLLLARGAARSTEMAVRLSLGATRGRLASQLLVESLLLAAMGGVASLLVTQWTLGALGALLPPQAASAGTLTLDASALRVAALLAAATGLIFGIFPAFHNTRTSLATSIREGAGKHSGSRSASRFRSSLVTTQIALSMTLLIVAGLFVRSLANVSRVNLGIKVERMLTFAVSPELNGYTRARSQQLFDQLERDLARVPGVTGVAASSVPLLAGTNRGTGVTVEGFPAGPDVDNVSRFDVVGPGFFSVVGVPMVAGREFSPGDGAESERVAIVNETFAKKFGLGHDAVGKYMGHHNGKTDIRIVGVAADAKYSEVKRVVPPVFFLAQRQDSSLGATHFYLRTAGDPAAIAPSVRRAVAALDPNLPVEQLKTMTQQVSENVFLDRMIGTLSAAFATLATLLAAIGLYGALAFTVAQRRREIGVRMALGANAGEVVRLVLRYVGLMTAVGGAIGIVGALALGRGAQSLLFGVSGADPVVIVGSVLALSLVALAGALVPAITAARVDPLEALRQE